MANPPTKPEVKHTASEFTTAFALEVLVRAGLLVEQQAKDILSKEMQAKARLQKAAGSAKYVPTPVEIIAVFQVPLANGEPLDQDKISEVVAQATGLGYKKIDTLKLDVSAATKTISKPFAQKHVILPLEIAPNHALVVSVANPYDYELFESLHRLTGRAIIPVLSAKQDILKGIADVYGFKRTIAAAASEHSENQNVSDFEQLVRLSSDKELDASDKPVVQAVDYLLRYAFENRASDIHIEPKRDTSLVRLRIDGVLHPVYTLPQQVHPPLVSRIKMISRMDISEKRRPQDGRIKIEKEGREVEIRVSSLPTAFGEKIVMRIFDPETLVQDIAMLGFDPDEKKAFESWIAEPHGLILVTGPTGSGKTTTLYSALKALSGPDVNVVTIEDPIEMVWDAFNQVQVQPKIGLDFAGALRHILRQDPDIVMVGEIRDAETAENAIQSALTGHLVLSTLHTNDAVGAVSRLRDLGVAPFLLSSCLLGVLAQRLLRKNCPFCSAPVTLHADQIAALKVPLPLGEGGVQIRKGAGCIKCRSTGYQGRNGVFEVFSATPEIRELINSGGSYEQILAAARRSGLRTLREAAVRKLAMGQTSYEEVLRMTTN